LVVPLSILADAADFAAMETSADCIRTIHDRPGVHCGQRLAGRLDDSSVASARLKDWNPGDGTRHLVMADWATTQFQ
jgi:hypothetical protein